MYRWPRALSHLAISPLDLSQFAIMLAEGQSRGTIRWSMRIISRRRLREFWESRKHDSGQAATRGRPAEPPRAQTEVNDGPEGRRPDHAGHLFSIGEGVSA